jgi:hypothetical protein
MKKIMKLAVAFSMLGLLFTACEKDKFTEEDAIESQQLIDVVINVLDRSNFNTPLDSALVVTQINGERIEKSTDNSGAVTFTDVKIGASLSVVVEKSSYLNATTTISTSTSNYRQGQISGNVYMYSLSSNQMATLRGKLTLESDLTNRDREIAAGVLVKAQNPYLNDYAEQYFYDSTDADGNYEIRVPINTSGSNRIDVIYPNIYANQSFAKELKNGTIQIVEREVEFRSNTYSTGIGVPAAPSAYLTIDNPPSESVGSGFQLGASVNPTAITSYSNYELVSGGSGFFGGADVSDARFYFNPGVNNDTAFVQVDIEGGSIVNIDYIDNNGALYTSTPTVNFTDGGTGAQIDVRFQATYDIYVAQNGSDYAVFPHVAVSVQDYSGDEMILRVDDDVNDGSDNILGSSYIFDNYAKLSGESIYADNSNGDTLFTSSPFAAAPEFEVLEDDQTERAVISLDYNDISSSDSSIYNYNIDDNGYGYDPLNPPTITIHSVNDLGSGADLRAEVNTSRELSNIEIFDGGEGYLRNVNDFKATGLTGNAYESPSYPTTTFYVSVSEVVIQNVHYGTGYQVVEEEEED